jgi:hypothetical protein
METGMIQLRIPSFSKTGILPPSFDKLRMVSLSNHLAKGGQEGFYSRFPYNFETVIAWVGEENRARFEARHVAE